MSLYPPAYPSRTYSRLASWRKPVPLPSVRESSEFSTETNSDRFPNHGGWSVPEHTSDEAPLIQRSKAIKRSNTWKSMRSHRSWLEPLDSIMSDSTSEQWKNPFPTIPISEHPDPSEPFAGACYPMPIAYPSDPLLLDRDPKFEVTWAKDGSDMPKNWPAWYRGVILACISFATLVV
jgi:hypothetical protein